MARGKGQGPASSSANPAPDGLHDEVDDFVAQRHKVMLEKATENDSASEDMGDEPEQNETNVLDIDMSDSDKSSSEEDEDENIESWKDREERLGFGLRKKSWYGGDTHEYEIMEDEEREGALRDEEEEALRLQQEALSRIQPEDYYDEGEHDEDEEIQEDENKRVKDRSATVAADVLMAAAPEVPLLVAEMVECYKQMEVWKGRIEWGELARILYHLNASFISNVAFYLSLRTDPEAEGFNIRTHPVLARIVEIRDLLKKAMTLPCNPPEKESKISKPLVVDNEIDNQTQGLEDIYTNGDVNGYIEGVGTESVPADEVEKRKRKERKRKRKEKKKQVAIAKDALAQTVQADEDVVRSILQKSNDNQDPTTDEGAQDRKRRKLNKLVGAMERERKNHDSTHLASADADVEREQPGPKEMPGVYLQTNVWPSDIEMGDMNDDDEVMKKMLAKKAKKEARKMRKEAEKQPHVYTFKDNAEPDSRRKASSQVVKNRGLTRYRVRDKKTPRVKNRMAYSKAVVRRKSTVREYIGKPGGSYSGESTGINMSTRKGSRLSNV